MPGNGKLTVVLKDAIADRPIGGVRVQVYWVEPGGDVLLKAASTNELGTTPTALLSGAKLSAGVYKLVLHAGDYLAATFPDRARCLDVVPIVFLIDDAIAGRRVEVALAADGYTVRCV